MFTGYRPSAVKAPVVDGANVIERVRSELDAKGLKRPKTYAFINTFFTIWWLEPGARQ